MINHHIHIRIANANDLHFFTAITQEMEASSKARGKGITQRSPFYIEQKMLEGKAVIATSGQNE